MLTHTPYMIRVSKICVSYRLLNLYKMQIHTSRKIVILVCEFLNFDMKIKIHTSQKQCHSSVFNMYF